MDQITESFSPWRFGDGMLPEVCSPRHVLREHKVSLIGVWVPECLSANSWCCFALAQTERFQKAVCLLAFCQEDSRYTEEMGSHPKLCFPFGSARRWRVGCPSHTSGAVLMGMWWPGHLSSAARPRRWMLIVWENTGGALICQRWSISLMMQYREKAKGLVCVQIRIIASPPLPLWTTSKGKACISYSLQC